MLCIVKKVVGGRSFLPDIVVLISKRKIKSIANSIASIKHLGGELNLYCHDILKLWIVLLSFNGSKKACAHEICDVQDGGCEKQGETMEVSMEKRGNIFDDIAMQNIAAKL